MTSSVQGEGKTSLCLSLGRHAAMSGRRAIVVDCDLRLPRVHEGLNFPNEAGVIEFLEGGSLTDVLRTDAPPGCTSSRPAPGTATRPSFCAAPACAI